jgi:hypothetical protein
MSGQRDVETQKVLRAERLELVDSAGRVRARIGPRSEGDDGETWQSYRLEMLDSSGTVVACLSVDDSGTDEDHVARLRVGQAFGPNVVLESVDRAERCLARVKVDSGTEEMHQITARREASDDRTESGVPA